MTGPNPSRLWLTCGVVVLPVLVFLGRLLADDHSVSRWHAVPSILISIATLLSLLCTSCTEPGIIQREDPQRRFKGEGVAPSRVEQIVNGVKVHQRWCGTCQIYRPPRAKHCVFCDNCINRFDHHCPWVSNCIGARNYRYFVTFISSGCALAWYFLSVMVFILLSASRDAQELVPEDFLVDFGLDLALILFSVCVAVPLTNLVAYHAWLVSTNVTTNEHMTRSYGKQNPYDLGVKANLRQFFLAPQEASSVSTVKAADTEAVSRSFRARSTADVTVVEV